MGVDLPNSGGRDILSDDKQHRISGRAIAGHSFQSGVRWLSKKGRYQSAEESLTRRNLLRHIEQRQTPGSQPLCVELSQEEEAILALPFDEVPEAPAAPVEEERPSTSKAKKKDPESGGQKKAKKSKKDAGD